MHLAELFTKPFGHLTANLVTHEAVDHRDIEVVPEDATQPIGDPDDQVQEAIDQLAIHKEEDNFLREPLGRPDEEEIVGLVEVVFVLQAGV